MAFLEMALAGTTTVGEFHYLHNDPNGRPYDDPNLLSKQVIAAAQSVGIRIVLLRTAYLRSGHELPPDPGQTRFFESTAAFLENLDALIGSCPASQSEVHFGVAPHSIRAVPLHDLKEIAAWSRQNKLPLHMHVAEQVAENKTCLREYGYTPVALFNKERLPGLTSLLCMLSTSALMKSRCLPTPVQQYVPAQRPSAISETASSLPTMSWPLVFA